MTTVRSEFWGSGFALIYDKNPNRTHAERVFRRGGLRVINELLDTLIGAAAGGSASKTHSRIEAPSDGDVGGKRTIESVTDISRVTTAADVTDLKTLLTRATAPTYVADASGNGGAAFTPG